MKSNYNILVINPGSTSTKVSFFVNDRESASGKIIHTREDLKPFPRIMDQAAYREELISAFLGDSGISAEGFDAVIGRGGLLDPLTSGVYRINDAMLAVLKSGKNGEHASNLGAILAKAAADRAGCPAFIADPVVVDELDDLSRLSGIPEIPRLSIFHALNHKACGRAAARKIGKPYGECRLIIAHLGGGISVGAHLYGRVVDVNNALDGEGPFSPERAGTVPAGQLLSLAFSGRVVDVNNALDGEGPFSPERAGTVPAGQLLSLALSGSRGEAELRRLLTGGGGMTAYCGTNSLEELCGRAESGDKRADLVLKAMAFQISREIAGHGATLSGKVDRIVLTGGMAHNKKLTDLITARVGFLAPLEIFPGEREMEALAENALMALKGQAEVKEYGV